MEKTILSFSPLSAQYLFFLCSCLVLNIPGGNGKDDQFRTLCAVPGFDYFNLTALPWFVSAKSPSCLPLPNSTWSQQQTVSQCLILMRFCRTLEHFGIVCKNSSVCQQSAKGDVSLGAYKDNPFLGSNSSHDGFDAALGEGAPYHTSDGKPCSVRSLVTFHCNPSVRWEAPSGFVGIKRAPDPRSVEYDAKTCEIKLSFDYAGACQTKTLQGETVLGIGSVILIVFSITIALYFILGCIVNAAKGNSGSRLIPHVAMWSSLISYISDGFKFTCCPDMKPVRVVAYKEIKEVID